MRTITPAPVRKSLVVEAPPELAFEVFVNRFGLWWPKSHHIGAADPETFVIEPRAGGRWFERGVDGSECDVGKVKVFEPPSRLVLDWQLSAEWKFDSELHTDVEVRFTAVGQDRTRVELEHRNLERFGDRAEAMRGQIDAPGGWGGLLELFATFVKQTQGVE
jgi:uncharacterized protein YndB with AHSA1/START domain